MILKLSRAGIKAIRNHKYNILLAGFLAVVILLIFLQCTIIP